LVLRLNAPQLASLPWEALFDPETESYLCQTEPLLHHIPAADYSSYPLQVVPPLRILGVVASPRGLPALDAEAERGHLARALAGSIQAGRIELTWAPRATWDEIHEQLLAGPWHVLHFIGHGDYHTDTDEGEIALVRPDGRADSVEASRLVDLLSTARPVPRLVVLNSCYSGRSKGQDLFSGTAAAMARSGISAVAAMQFTVSDVGAVAFAHGFYAALANGRSVDEAARNGRISMRGTSAGTLEWVTPVLYVRGNSTELFVLTPQLSVTPVPPPTTNPVEEGAAGVVDYPAPEAQMHALYLRAGKELTSKHCVAAIRLLDELLSLDPTYQGGVFLRDTARRRYAAERRYLMAREAEDEHDWATDAAGYVLLASDPAFPDAAARGARCEKQQRDTARERESRSGGAGGEVTLPLPIVKSQSDGKSKPSAMANRVRNALASPRLSPDTSVPSPPPQGPPAAANLLETGDLRVSKSAFDLSTTPFITPSALNPTLFQLCPAAAFRREHP
jgi:hypothetical protein